MASWSKFFEEAGKGFERSYTRSADRRERRKELKKQREYEEETHERREKEKRDKADRAITEVLSLKQRKPVASKILGALAKEERGIGPSPEAASETFVSPLVGSAERFRKEQEDASSKGGRVLREEGDILGALRDASLEKKTAISKMIDTGEAAYSSMLEKHVDTVERLATSYEWQKPEEKAATKAEMDRLRRKYEGDSEALEALDLAAQSGKADASSGIGKMFKQGQMDKAERDLKRTEEYKGKEPYILELLKAIDGEERPTHKEQALNYYNADAIPKLVKDAEDAQTYKGLIALAEGAGIEVPTGVTSLKVLQAWAEENIPALGAGTESEKKLRSVSKYRNKAIDAKARLDEAVQGEENFAQEEEAYQAAFNELKLVNASTFTKGWEIDVNDDGELIANKVSDDDDNELNYKISYYPTPEGVMAYIEPKEGIPKAEYDQIIKDANEDIIRFGELAQVKILNSGKAVVGKPNEASKGLVSILEFKEAVGHLEKILEAVQADPNATAKELLRAQGELADMEKKLVEKKLVEKKLEEQRRIQEIPPLPK